MFPQRAEDNMRLRSTWIDVLQITQNIIMYGSQDAMPSQDTDAVPFLSTSPSLQSLPETVESQPDPECT